MNSGCAVGILAVLGALALVIMYLVGSTSVRFREQESRLVVLARQVALFDAEMRFRADRPTGTTFPLSH